MERLLELSVIDLTSVECETAQENRAATQIVREQQKGREAEMNLLHRLEINTCL
jgi:hypothetical protein